jgi:cell division protein FtsL
MAERVPQTFANHARLVPGYHFVAFFLVFVNLVYTVVQLVRAPATTTVAAVLAAVALVLVWLYARVFALSVQDRVIRLEMQLRLQRVLPEDLRARVGEITRGQFVALRFASDAELPQLVRQVLEGKLTDKKQIKLAVKDWQADYLRA